MKKILLLAAVAVALASCEKTIFPNKIEDKPWIEFAEENITVDAEGNDWVVIEVNSTGIDDASIRLIKNYETDSENGDLVVQEPWAEIVKVINEYDYEATRALAKWGSAIVVKVKPNDSGKVRQAVITARSFTLNDTIELIQEAE